MSFTLEMSEIQKKYKKIKITGVIAPEHVVRHDNHEKKLAKQEKALIEAITSHCSVFCKEFEGVAKGDWTKSAMTELDEINQSLKSIVD